MKASESGPPLVTVGVGNYNHRRFVIEALESVVAQTYPNIELIIADDCSRDDSPSMIREWIATRRPGTPFLAHDTNRGVCATFNEIVARARGKYLALFSADDVWLPHKVASQVAVFEADGPDLGVVFSEARQMDEEGRELPERFIEQHRPGVAVPEGRIFADLLPNNFIPALTAMTRMECFKAVGTYDESLVFEDWDMWLRIARQYRFRYQPEPTARYRVVATSMARTRQNAMWLSAEYMFFKCLDRGWLEEHPATRERVLESLQVLAYEWYRTRDPRRHWALRLLWRHRRRQFGHLLACVAARAGVPYETFLALRWKLKK